MLSAGDSAPKIKLPADDGSQFDLAAKKGEHVIVYFYPRDDTPGCTVEAIDFSKQAAALKKLGATVVGISKDSIASHVRFRDKHALKVSLLSDPDLTVHKAFGAWGEKTMYGKKVEGVIRSTFLIGPDGKVKRAWPSVKVAGHVDAVIAALKGGDAPAKPAAKTTKAVAKATKPAEKKPAPKLAAEKKAVAKKPVSKKPAGKKA